MSQSQVQREQLTSSELYEACANSNTAVQTEGYQILWQYLYRIAYNISYKQPDAAALAQDCAQKALIRVHQQFDQCQEVNAFKSWARRIVSNLVIDELRRRKRLVRPTEEKPLEENPEFADDSLETVVLAELTAVSLRLILQKSPMSDRSQRVVIGRYLDNFPDEQLARTESGLTNQAVAPSHIQVTRAKNIAKLRQWDYLRSLFTDG